ncbi:hypothetical protein EMPS_09901 [Entomortierella parvispora]|uniref:Uncharacterized protein n=1 Tax=Entomortierella parvispora TaxID=205924 RepID=A0A9P3HCY7_9FUNG|nr:hypothetical protein EMPS_00094 [Entomortierella parvispora]GJJ71497.1 hypothetical protein EMPS_03847 [Entomortierella parvispora]GJJ74419.1 hypothetical protein EMPS_06777 [Entomortierella parvispora]GJJ77377.1 hypothetical protein EMPS_09736 [Entomortierella parvispora]GJJ77542.1 hypothetical protein EMPS_09901 [Entomortierella parvispora]
MSDATTQSSPDIATLAAAVLSLTQKLSDQDRLLKELQDQATESDIRPGQVVYKSDRATTLLQYPELQNQYPAITQKHFFNTVLPAGHNLFDWNDYHYTDGMVYKAPPVLEHQGVTLPELARKHEQDLAKIQGHMANSTRLFDTLVDEILTYEMDADELAKHVISFVNTARILVSNDASKISLMRKDIYLRHLELPTSEPQENAILTLEDLAKRRTTVDLVSKTYTKPSVKESKRPLHKKPGFKKKQPEDSDKKSTHEKSKESTNSRDGGGRNNRPYKARKSSNYDDNKSAGDKGNGSEKERQ